MKSKIYLIIGATGDYEEYREWPVCFYYSRSTALRHAKKAEARANELQPVYNKQGRDAIKGQNEYDKHMDMDTAGTTYEVHPLHEGTLKRPEPRTTVVSEGPGSYTVTLKKNETACRRCRKPTTAKDSLCRSCKKSLKFEAFLSEAIKKESADKILRNQR